MLSESSRLSPAPFPPIRYPQPDVVWFSSRYTIRTLAAIVKDPTAHFCSALPATRLQPGKVHQKLMPRANRYPRPHLFAAGQASRLQSKTGELPQQELCSIKLLPFGKQVQRRIAQFTSISRRQNRLASFAVTSKLRVSPNFGNKRHLTFGTVFRARHGEAGRANRCNPAGEPGEAGG
jgi:hypothetical protein